MRRQTHKTIGYGRYTDCRVEDGDAECGEYFVRIDGKWTLQNRKLNLGDLSFLGIVLFEDVRFDDIVSGELVPGNIQDVCCFEVN